MHADFQEHGVQVIAAVRTEKPDQYLKVIASILPKELHVNTTAITDMSDDELAGILDGVRSLLLAGAVEAPGGGNKAASRH
jgi:hypothetical protein